MGLIDGGQGCGGFRAGAETNDSRSAGFGVAVAELVDKRDSASVRVALLAADVHFGSVGQAGHKPPCRDKGAGQGFGIVRLEIAPIGGGGAKDGDNGAHGRFQGSR